MLSFSEIVAVLRERFDAHAVVNVHEGGMHPWVEVVAGRWVEVAGFLRDEPRLGFGMLRCVTGLDHADKKQLVVAYELMAMEHRHVVCVKVVVARDQGHELHVGGGVKVPSVAGVWRAADWHEREAFDLLGIYFEGHPDRVTDKDGTVHPRRILLPDDWKGHPLRKDYAFPREYHGIPGSVEMDWAQKSEYPK